MITSRVLGYGVGSRICLPAGTHPGRRLAVCSDRASSEPPCPPRLTDVPRPPCHPARTPACCPPLHAVSLHDSCPPLAIPESSEARGTLCHFPTRPASSYPNRPTLSRHTHRGSSAKSVGLNLNSPPNDFVACVIGMLAGCVSTVASDVEGRCPYSVFYTCNFRKHGHTVGPCVGQATQSCHQADRICSLRWKL